MKAYVYREYGLPEVLRLEDVPIPEPRPDELRVLVHYVSLNASDWEILRGEPLYSRVWGWFKPGHPVLGSDIAGRVDAVGANVEGFAVGDDVYGDTLGTFGGFAEYACAPSSVWRHRPAELTAEHACTLPQGGLIALQALRDVGKVGAGTRVLLNGAGGSAGSFAIQLGKYLGAHVTGVDNAEKLDHMRKLGADVVIDYAEDDFARRGDQYDFVLDLVASRPLRSVRRAVAEGGRYLVAGGTMNALLQAALLGPLLGTGGRKLGVLAHEPNRGLEELAQWVIDGVIQPAIDRRFPLQKVPDALRYHGEGHACGKVVIEVPGA